MGIIYKHTNQVNGKAYIGQTIQTIQKRWYSHCKDARNNPNTTVHFHRAINKYGEDSFEHEVLIDNIPYELLNPFEVGYIIREDSLKNGYNMTVGGQGDTRYSGYKLSKEFAENCRIRSTGRKLSSKAKNKLRHINIGVKSTSFKPWYIKDMDGKVSEFYDMTKSEYADQNGLHKQSFIAKFQNDRADRVVSYGKYKGMMFGNIKEKDMR